jgi:hypothetical protein
MSYSISRAKLVMHRDSRTWFEWLSGVYHFHLAFDMNHGLLIQRRTSEQQQAAKSDSVSSVSLAPSIVIHLATRTEQFLLSCEWNASRQCYQCVGWSSLLGGGASLGEHRGDIYMGQECSRTGALVFTLEWQEASKKMTSTDLLPNIITLLVRDFAQGGTSLSLARLGWLN